MILNPGTQPYRSYFSIPDVDTITVFEGSADTWSTLTSLTCDVDTTFDQRAVLIHGVTDVAHMRQYIDQQIKLNIHYTYVTDRTFASGPWLDIATFWDDLVAYIAEKNAQLAIQSRAHCIFLPLFSARVLAAQG